MIRVAINETTNTMLEIRTNQLKTRKKVLIDDHEYTVRRMGNIEQMDYNQYMRRLSEIAKKEVDLKDKPLPQEEAEEAEQLSVKMTEMFVDLFDDGGDQTKSRKLVASLSDVELGVLLGQIFAEGGDAES